MTEAQAKREIALLATRREELEKWCHGDGVLGKAHDDEPLFILRAQDCFAADLVEKWAIWARAGGTPPNKVQEAFMLVEEMRRWPKRKTPDCSGPGRGLACGT
jgi:hypothetical protein